jgi:transcriptional regulator with XRE-family HTH domain
MDSLTSGEAIRRARKAKEWKLRQVTAETKISESTLSAIERGQRGLSPDIARKLCECLDLDFDQLMNPPTITVAKLIDLASRCEGLAPGGKRHVIQSIEVWSRDYQRWVADERYLERLDYRQGSAV